MKLIFFVVLFLAGVMAAEAHASESDEAKAAFNRGKTLHEQGRYGEAADEFRKAQTLRPSFSASAVVSRWPA